MFGLGSSSQRARFVNWRIVGLYGVALIAAVAAGWVISRVA
jgi:hypothetical protein